MECNQSRPGFELVSPCPFPTTLTITPPAPREIYILCFFVFLCVSACVLIGCFGKAIFLSRQYGWICLKQLCCIRFFNLISLVFVWKNVNVSRKGEIVFSFISRSVNYSVVMNKNETHWCCLSSREYKDVNIFFIEALICKKFHIFLLMINNT